MTGQLWGTLIKGHEDVVTSVSFSPDGKTLVSGSDDKTVRVWDRQTGRQLGETMTHGSPIDSVFFSEDGRRLYSQSSDSIRVWDVKTHQSVGKPIRGSYITALAISPDGRRIAAVDVGTIQQWDAESGEPVGQQIQGHFKIATDIEYNSDGRYLVSVGRDATVRFWDARTGNPRGMPVRTTGLGRHRRCGAEQRRPACVRHCTARYGRNDGWGYLGNAGACRVAGHAVRQTRVEPDRSRVEQWVSSDPDVGYVKLCPNKPIRPRNALNNAAPSVS